MWWIGRGDCGLYERGERGGGRGRGEGGERGGGWKGYKLELCFGLYERGEMAGERGRVEGWRGCVLI